jgi:hypothetical protein
MSKILATDHFETQNWEITFENLAPNYADLFIGFTDDAPVIEFKDLKFKYELKQDGNIKEYGEYPPPNVKYVRSDQKYLVVKRLKLTPETEYELYLWAKNDKDVFETTVEFITPRPKQPYPSWVWDGEKWNAPIPEPEDDMLYDWDEKNQKWIEAENNS